MPIPAIPGGKPPAITIMSERAIQAALAEGLNSFSAAYTPDKLKNTRASFTMTKNCSPTHRVAVTCDSTTVKQIVFIQPNYKIAIMSCPFAAQDRDGHDVIAGSFGDEMDVICPIAIRMRDFQGGVMSVVKSRDDAENLKWAISTSNPIDEEGPPLDPDFEAEPPGPDRIKLRLTNPAARPCFIRFPKTFPLAAGMTFPIDTNTPVTEPSMEDLELSPEVTTEAALWYEAMRYGIKHLGNYSLQSRDTLFIYEGLEKAQLDPEGAIVAARFTTIVDFLPATDDLYKQVIEKARVAKHAALFNFGMKLMDTAKTPPTPDTQTETQQPDETGPSAKVIANSFATLAQAITELKSSDPLVKEKASDAKESERFYQLLFSSAKEIQGEEGGDPVSTIYKPAIIHPMFLAVLSAQKVSKATRIMQEAVETTAADLSTSRDMYASAANLIPSLFDQPMTMALRNANWEYKHTVLNTPGLKTSIGIHHFAPPRTTSIVYKERIEGETKIYQQEQVGEDKSRVNTRTTDLYHFGKMCTTGELSEMIGNFFALMNVIIVYDDENPPVLWEQVMEFDRILRSAEGRQWTDAHRNVREVIFNVGQELQSSVSGFVAEARKYTNKNRIAEHSTISPEIFKLPLRQSMNIRNNLVTIMLTMTAGHFRESNMLYKICNPEASKKRDTPSGGNTANQPSNPPANRNRGNGNQSQTGNPPNAAAPGQATGPPLPGKVVFVHEDPQPERFPHPGAIFPHPSANRENQFTTMCYKSAYAGGRRCIHPTCQFYHFPSNLGSMPAALKTKLKAWVASTPKVTWHPNAAPAGNVTFSGPPAIRTPPN